MLYRICRSVEMARRVRDKLLIRDETRRDESSEISDGCRGTDNGETPHRPSSPSCFELISDKRAIGASWVGSVTFALLETAVMHRATFLWVSGSCGSASGKPCFSPLRCSSPPARPFPFIGLQAHPAVWSLLSRAKGTMVAVVSDSGSGSQGVFALSCAIASSRLGPGTRMPPVLWQLPVG